ncbi:hypothetical protein HMPREF3039_01693 [Akkermansia sp. KLE1798]|nr:hypothetical protein HMPREF3039_01693 [Akkermansia sp. KLE1798]
MTNSIAEPAAAALRPFERMKPLYRKKRRYGTDVRKRFQLQPAEKLPAQKRHPRRAAWRLPAGTAAAVQKV